MKKYTSAIAFRQALEERLKNIAAERKVALQGLRVKVAIERLLARLFQATNSPWLLKGGYAMELRYRPMARATKDIDLTLLSMEAIGAKLGELDEIREALQKAGEMDLEDFFSFRIEEAKKELDGPAYGGVSYPVEAQVAGRQFVRFSIDVGIGDPSLEQPEMLEGEALLEFAGIPAAKALAISKAQQFAEKIHAYTYPWGNRINSRTKDLVDLILLIERGELNLQQAYAATYETFKRRASHIVPTILPKPPIEWKNDFQQMATEIGLKISELDKAYVVLTEFWVTVLHAKTS